jgi:hypothetical protein
MPSASGYYRVSPRYTGGSQALTDRSTAYRVAQEETQAYIRALSGRHGDPSKAAAECMGLRGICELRIERGRGKTHRFEVHDLCTVEWLEYPIGSVLQKMGYRHYTELGERAQRAIDESPPQGFGDWRKQGWFKLEDGRNEVYRPNVIQKA